ncbi:hypothetical protein NFX46_24790 [Streptomyces phaeoluteigriseus]|uniref:Uncharacterized protein n=1 Tax=Streptomyces phaeoluteigriseus TaxID=114686 RepID=A0ABY4ZCG8_9ACTN|nr:hypothetical protein [Streptomyces phaeoluteigriseus]USQ86635.1 hypothetical protein NFX46_24790 [Streptomyces phaeoluteigriseus]
MCGPRGLHRHRRLNGLRLLLDAAWQRAVAVVGSAAWADGRRDGERRRQRGERCQQGEQSVAHDGTSAL